MKTIQQILDYSLTIFDVAGIHPISVTESVLILGLESTSQRNLDDFRKINNRLVINGFIEYVRPGLELLVQSLEGSGITAKIIGEHGYTLRGAVDFINYKTYAIKTGLGKRGKNSIILNPIFGSRLRFAALRIKAVVGITERYSEEASTFCKNCSICIDECPVDILEPYQMIDVAKCLSNIKGKVAGTKGQKVIMCDICLQKCPANQSDVKE